MYTPNCDAFWVGSYPLKDPMAASRRIVNTPSLLLHWPQLPKRAKKENFVEQTYAALATKDDNFSIGTAAGWNAMWRVLKRQPKAWLKHTHFKTQLAGPITLFGKLQADGLSRRTKTARSLRSKNEQLLRQYITLWLQHAYWQIDTIREAGFKPIVVLDEPLLPTYMGTSGTQRARKTMTLLKSIVKRLRRRGATVGIHCCNRISPTVLIATGADLVHFDAHYFPTQIARARSDIQAFLKNGGIVAWGIVPTTEMLTSANRAKIEKSLKDMLASMETRGLSLRSVLAQSMVAPTCGTGLLSTEQSDKILDFTTSLAQQLKSRYKLE